MCEVVATYLQCIEDMRPEIITVQRYPDGKFYNHYGNWKGHCIAGYYDTQEKAEEMVLKHRPSAKKIKVVDREKKHYEMEESDYKCMMDCMEGKLKNIQDAVNSGYCSNEEYYQGKISGIKSVLSFIKLYMKEVEEQEV